MGAGALIFKRDRVVMRDVELKVKSMLKSDRDLDGVID